MNDASTSFTPRLYVRNRRATWIARGTGLDDGLVVAAVLVAATHVGGVVVDPRWLSGRALPRRGRLDVADLRAPRRRPRDVRAAGRPSSSSWAARRPTPGRPRARSARGGGGAPRRVRRVERALLAAPPRRGGWRARAGSRGTVRPPLGRRLGGRRAVRRGRSRGSLEDARLRRRDRDARGEEARADARLRPGRVPVSRPVGRARGLRRRTLGYRGHAAAPGGSR